VNRVTKIYKELLEFANFLHLKVHHKYRIQQLGELDLFNNQITVAKQNKNTLLGCFILAHELGHYADFLSGRYSKFFLTDANKGLANTAQNRKLIENAEWSAIKFACKILKLKGFEVSNKEWVDKKIFRKKLLPIWHTQYTKPQRKK
jgi:hypothetical protein